MATNSYGWRWQLGCPCCEESFVYIGGQPFSLASTISHRRLVESDGSISLSLSHGGASATAVFAIATDADGHFYIGGNSAGGVDIRKQDSAGTDIWTALHGGQVLGIAVDASGNVVVGGGRASNITTRYYNSSGTEIWTADHGQTVNDVAFDSDGNVVTVGVRSVGTPFSLRKYDSAGNLLWSRDHGATVSSVAVDGDGNIYTIGSPVTVGADQISTRKYDSDGNQLLQLENNRSFPLGNLAIAVDAAQLIYRSQNNWIEKLQADGTLVWDFDHGNRILGIVVGDDGSVYFCGNRFEISVGLFATARKLDSSGSEVWSFDHGQDLFGIDLSPGAYPIFRGGVGTGS